MPRKRGRRSKFQEELARERIERLFVLAEESSNDGEIEESKRFIELARLIGKRYNQRFKNLQRVKFCRKCNSFLNSKNSKNRISSKGWKIITCLSCGYIGRHGLKNGNKQ